MPCIALTIKRNMQQENQLLSSAEEMFMKYGVKSVTMDDIARNMGMSKKTLYTFVANKANLIEKIFQQKVIEEKEIMAQIKASATDAIDEMIQIVRYVLKLLRKMSPTVVYDLKKYYQNTWNHIDHLHCEHVYDLIKENITRGKEQGIFRAELDEDIIAKLYVHTTSTVVDAEHFPATTYDWPQLFKAYIEYHIRGIATAKGLKLFEKQYQDLESA